MKYTVYNISNKRGFISLIELLLAAVIILFIGYIMLNLYTKGSYIDKKTKKVLEEGGIDTSGYKGILDSTKRKIEDINKQTVNRNRQY